VNIFREEDFEISSVANVLLKFCSLRAIQTYCFSGICSCAFQFQMQSNVLQQCRKNFNCAIYL